MGVDGGPRMRRGHLWGFRKPSIATIVLSSSNNAVLFNLAGSPTTAGDFVFKVPTGVLIGTTSINTPSLRTGVFPTGSNLWLVNEGEIYGYGGAGGTAGYQYWGTIMVWDDVSQQMVPTGGWINVGGGGGAGGGPAILLEYNLSIDTSVGIIGGGGGGGGGNGSGSIGGTGAGAQGASTGNGGALGTAGSSGSSGGYGGGGAGGAAGKAIDLNGKTVTWLGGNNPSQVKGLVA